jgi:hypothetical protein
MANPITTLDALLEARGRTHGDYAVHALITQDLKRVITHHVADLGPQVG